MESPNLIGTYEARTRFSELIDRVAGGEEFTITRHGSPVARLTPVEKTATPEERRKAIEQIAALREQLSLGGEKIKDLINEGRP